MAKGVTHKTRIVFGLKNYKTTGYEMEKLLRVRYNTDVEMSDRFNVVAIATTSNTREEIDRLFAAVKEILEGIASAEDMVQSWRLQYQALSVA